MRVKETRLICIPGATRMLTNNLQELLINVHFALCAPFRACDLEGVAVIKTHVPSSALKQIVNPYLPCMHLQLEVITHL